MARIPRGRSSSHVAAKKQRSWMDVILDLDDDEAHRPSLPSSSRREAAARIRAAQKAGKGRSAGAGAQSLPRCTSEPVAWDAKKEEEESKAGRDALSRTSPALLVAATSMEEEMLLPKDEASGAVLYCRASALSGTGKLAFSQESIAHAYAEAKKEMGVRYHEEKEREGRPGGLPATELWQQDVLTQQLQMELQDVRTKLLDAQEQMAAAKALQEESGAVAQHALQAEQWRREQAEAELVLVRKERDILAFGSSLKETNERLQRQEEAARELLEGEVRVLKQSLLLAHEQATSDDGSGVYECLEQVRRQLAALTEDVEQFERSGLQLAACVQERQTLEKAAVTKLREVVNRQEATKEQRDYQHGVEQVGRLHARLAAILGLATAPPEEAWQGAEADSGEFLSFVTPPAAEDGTSLRRSRSSEMGSRSNPSLGSVLSPRDEAARSSTASLLLFGSAAPHP